ncbi:MAG TPA: hypothetical protein PKN86_21090 [Candidatus Obscuribacter sp.]|nr:hypothetical protein [Candidatus Obscuribacter sp.]HNG76470.1 hypothetical protein [Candidatus Obscuribacter sp.]HNM52230.1 hypothetical protein [Candidatus Obscuribacter sp.]
MAESRQAEFDRAKEKFEQQCPSSIAAEAWSADCKAISNKNARDTADNFTAVFPDGASLMKEFGKNPNDVITPKEMAAKIDELTNSKNDASAFQKADVVSLLSIAVGQTQNPNLTAERYDKYIANLRKGI